MKSILCSIPCTAAIALFLSQSVPNSAAAAPANDNFVDATAISSLPYYTIADTTGATPEEAEPYNPCSYVYPLNSVWYSYTASSTETVMAIAEYYYIAPALAVFDANLNLVGCTSYSGALAFQAIAGQPYYFQLSGLYGEEGPIPFRLEVAPPPNVYLNLSDYEYSIYDSVGISAYVNDAANSYPYTFQWTISDGTVSSDEYLQHQFAADGDYTVSVTVTTADGRTASASDVIHIVTRDVAISKLTAPQSASANQTKTISVDVTNKRYSDYVRVRLYKGVAGGYEQEIGSSLVYVPARAKKPTSFVFNYTFTNADASVGKVAFRAEATIENSSYYSSRDAYPSDNLAVASTIVRR
ncbi:MAG: PKD domain-containing protein [Verrucomicrobiales bacterium]